MHREMRKHDTLYINKINLPTNCKNLYPNNSYVQDVPAKVTNCLIHVLINFNSITFV